MPDWAPDIDFVAVFAKAWTDFTLFVKLIERVFDYMNRYCISKLARQHTTEISFFAFKSQVFEEFKDKLVDSVVSLIQKKTH